MGLLCDSVRPNGGQSGLLLPANCLRLRHVLCYFLLTHRLSPSLECRHWRHIKHSGSTHTHTAPIPARSRVSKTVLNGGTGGGKVQRARPGWSNAEADSRTCQQTRHMAKTDEWARLHTQTFHYYIFQRADNEHISDKMEPTHTKWRLYCIEKNFKLIF